jgi:hypothetical protein
MKILKYILFLFLVGVFSSSCSKSYLDQQPLGSQTNANFYNNPDNAILAVNAIYQGIAMEEGNPSNFSGWDYEWAYGDVMSDDAEKGSTPGDFPDMLDLKYWQVKSNSNQLTHAHWTNMYLTIFRANTVLENVPNASFNDDALKKRLKGEALFLRAYCFWNLMDKFGPIPLLTKTVAYSDWGKIKQASLSAIYTQIYADLDSAINDLPERSEYGSADLGRATKGAARAYKARAMMYQIGTIGPDANANWTNVLSVCNDIINSKEYSLVSNYATIFEMEGENNSESVFEIQYGSDGLNNYDVGGVGTNTVQIEGDRSTYGWGFNNPTTDLLNSYETGDLRKYCTAYGNGDAIYGVPQIIKLSENYTGYLNRKVAWDKVTYPLSNWRDCPYNKRMVRYSDVLLMYAEAAANLNQYPEAQAKLNMVRARARNCSYPKGYTAGSNDYTPSGNTNILPDITATGTDLLNAIYNERRHELGMESLRFYDLVRTGQYLTMLQTKYPASATQGNVDVHAQCLAHCITTDNGKATVNPIPVVPIPLGEVNSWNLVQNPGY